MSEPIGTYSQAQNHEQLIGDDAGDLWNDGGLNTSLPINGISGMHASGSHAFGWKPRCPGACPCSNITDLDLGTIGYSYTDILGIEAPRDFSENYQRVSLFEILDGGSFGDTLGTYAAGVIRTRSGSFSNTTFGLTDPVSRVKLTPSPIEGCNVSMFVIFSQPSNSHGEAGGGIGPAFLSWGADGRRVAIADWTFYPYYSNSTSIQYFSESYEPSGSYVNQPTTAGPWADFSEIHAFEISRHSSDGTRPLTGSEFWPTPPTPQFF